MRILLIGCEVIIRELCDAVARSPHVVDARFLSKGLHDRGARAMRAGLQAAIDEAEADAEKYDAIALGYGLCGNGRAGLEARSVPLVLPRPHDCITLLMGSRTEFERYFQDHPGVYYRSTGWVERGADLRQQSQADVRGQSARVDLLGAADPVKCSDHARNRTERSQQWAHPHDRRDRSQPVFHSRDDLGMELGDQQLLDLRQSFLAVSKGDRDPLRECLVPVGGALANAHGRVELPGLAKLLHLADKRLGIAEGFLAQGSIEQDSIINAPDREKRERQVDDIAKGVDDPDDIHAFTVQSVECE